MTNSRQTWDQYFINLTKAVSERATCSRAKVGAIIVRDHNILATGYNGSPAGHPHCLDVGCLVYKTISPAGDVEENCYRTIHAEINAIAQAAKSGTLISGASIYVTHSPCYHCMKTLINTGIQKVYWEKNYKVSNILPLLQASSIYYRQMENV